MKDMIPQLKILQDYIGTGTQQKKDIRIFLQRKLKNKNGRKNYITRYMVIYWYCKYWLFNCL